MPGPRPRLRKNMRMRYESAQTSGDGKRATARAAGAGEREPGAHEAHVAAIAASQHGNVTRRKLLSSGISERSIVRRVQSGRLFREHAGVYAVGRPTVTPVERAAAAVLACGAHAALSHRSAMVLWGFWQRWSNPFEVTVARGCPRPPGVIVHRSTSLTTDDVVIHLGIPVTTPSRTIHDIAARLSDVRLARTVDDAMHSGF
jgi:Transcriptional regulator, AbiEi antitoxin